METTDLWFGGSTSGPFNSIAVIPNLPSAITGCEADNYSNTPPPTLMAVFLLKFEHLWMYNIGEKLLYLIDWTDIVLAKFRIHILIKARDLCFPASMLIPRIHRAVR